jgi:hypothetical protein
MRDNITGSALVCTWVAVTDEAGRTHMEARWTQSKAVAAHAA